MDFYPDYFADEELEEMLDEYAYVDQYRDFCRRNPWHPRCDRERFCRRNPWHPRCDRWRDRDFCRRNPWHPRCRGRRDFCRRNPWHPSCR